MIDRDCRLDRRIQAVSVPRHINGSQSCVLIVTVIADAVPYECIASRGGNRRGRETGYMYRTFPYSCTCIVLPIDWGSVPSASPKSISITAHTCGRPELASPAATATAACSHARAPLAMGCSWDFLDLPRGRVALTGTQWHASEGSVPAQAERSVLVPTALLGLARLFVPPSHVYYPTGLRC